MSKVYLIIRTIYVKIKSMMIMNFLRMWGLKVGKGTMFWNKPTISGYLNKISIGENCCIDERVRIIVNKEGSLKIGDNTLVSANVNINAGVGNITIGSNTMVAANCYIINNDHDVYDALSVRNSGHITNDIVIEDNVWVAANVTILKGVTVGEGAIIGSGSIVTKDVKPYSINFGTPCKLQKFRFGKDELVEKLTVAGYTNEKINNLICEKMEMHKFDE